MALELGYHINPMFGERFVWGKTVLYTEMVWGKI
jgi:hypothetical protein